MEELKLYLLGPPRLERDGGPSLLKRRKAMALLIYLAVTGQPHSREALVTLLWQDFDPNRGRNNLRRELAEVNKVLEKGWIFADREQIGLNLQVGLWLDVTQFQQLISICETHDHPASEVCVDCLPPLSEAAELYRGDFLVGFTLPDCPQFDEWQFFQAEGLRQKLAFALERLIRGYKDRQQFEQAIPYARRWVELDPLHEPAQRQLMRVYAWAGQQAAALRQYEKCEQILAEELGVPPDQETTSLFEAIKAKQLELPVQAGKQGARGTGEQKDTLPAFLADDAAPESPSAAFVARERELAELTATLETARNGQGQVLFVIGGAGRGKTTLIEEFARQAQAEGSDLLVVSGHCNAHTGLGDPYLPFREAVVMLTGDVEAKWAGGLISSHQARKLWEEMPLTLLALVEQAPDLIDSFIPAPALLERAEMVAAEDVSWFQRLRSLTGPRQRSSLEQQRLFSQYSALLKAIARHRPIMLIIEDLHWVDASSSALLFHLSREIGDSRILIVGTYRPVEVAVGWGDDQHPLAEIVTELKRQHGDIWLDLSDQAPNESRQFVEAYLDTQANRLDEAFREAVYRHTEGHPLFTVELIREMQERGDIHQDEDGRWQPGAAIDWQNLPARVEGVIEQRIGRLDKELQEILAVASIEGETFTAEVVAQVQQVNERSIVQQLSRILDKRHRLVTAKAIEHLNPGGQRLSQYRFQHHLFQHYLYHNLDEMEQTYLHEAVGMTLEKLYGQQTARVAVQLAHHFEQAGLIDKVVDYLGQAGDEAYRLYAYTEAITHYQKALEFAIQTPDVTSQQLIHLYRNMGRALELNSQYSNALQSYNRLQVLAEKRNDPAMNLAALMEQSKIYTTMNPEQDSAQGLSLSKRTLTLAQTLGDEEAEAKIHWNLLLFHLYNDGDLSQAIYHGEQAVSLERKFDPSEQLGYILNDLARAYVVAGQLEAGPTVLTEAHKLWQQWGNVSALVDNYVTQSQLSYLSGNYQQAIAESEEGFKIAQDSNNLWGQPTSRYIIGKVYFDLGQSAQIFKILQEMVVLCEQVGHIPMLIDSQAYLGRTYGLLGALQRGFQLAQQALTMADENFRLARINPLLTLAHLSIAGGDLTTAEIVLKDISSEPNPFLSWVDFSYPLKLANARLTMAKQEYNRTLAVTSELVTDLRQRSLRAFLPEALYYQGTALAELGELSEAHQVLTLACTESETMGERRMLWQILFVLSQLEADLNEAEVQREQSREIVEYIADHTPTPELKNSFLNLPKVRAVFEPISID